MVYGFLFGVACGFATHFIITRYKKTDAAKSEQKAYRDGGVKKSIK
jgi:hypothetical protein